MDKSTIPKTFWHTISLSILILTIVFAYIGIKASNISIKYANMEVTLSSAIREAENLKSDLESEVTDLKKNQHIFQKNFETLQQSQIFENIDPDEQKILKDYNNYISGEQKIDVPVQHFESKINDLKSMAQQRVSKD